MRVRLKGINRITKKLADGRTVTYFYAWKGGPALLGEPGSPEFVASYNEAVARKVTPPAGTIFSILRAYQDSDDFRELAERTKPDYVGKIKLIERKFGDFPLGALSDPRSPGIFLEWRDELPGKSRRQADYASSSWPACSPGRVAAGKSRSTRLRTPDASIADRGARRSGAAKMRLPSWRGRRRTCICRSCSPYGQGNDKVTFCGFHGAGTTASAFGFGNRRQARAWPHLLVRRSRQRWTPPPGQRRAH